MDSYAFLIWDDMFNIFRTEFQYGENPRFRHILTSKKTRTTAAWGSFLEKIPGGNSKKNIPTINGCEKVMSWR